MPTFLHHHLHHGHPDEFTQILRSRNLRAFAFGIARVFIPLFLITVYGGLEEALWPITVFILSAYGLRLLLMPQYATLVIKLGAKHAMTVSFIAGVVSLMMTAYLQPNLYYITVLGFFLGAANALYFLAYHIDLALTLNKTKAVKHGVGSVEMVRKVMLALGPLFGGVIATQISEKALFVVAAVFMAMAVSALYLKNDNVVSHSTQLKLGRLRTYRKYWRYFVANFAMGVNTNAASFLWSILLFVVIGTYQAVGFVLAISLVLSLVIITFTRRHDSVKSDRKEINGGSIATSVVHMVRPFVDTASMAAGVNFFNDIAYSFLYVPYVDRYYKRIRKKDGMTYVTLMEMSTVSGHLVMWLSYIGLFAVLGQNGAFIGAFTIAAIAALFVRLITRSEIMATMNPQSKLSKLLSVHWFFFLLLAVGAAGLGIQALRQNNLRMGELKGAVQKADETGEGIYPALNKLGEHVFNHMNTSTQVILASEYSRDAQEAIRASRPQTTSDEVYGQAIAECENPNIPLTARASCVAEYVNANSPNTESKPIEDIIPPEAPYRYSFAAPLWSADFAGLSLLASTVLIGLGVWSWLRSE